jgi:DNA repair protein RecO (recombination protein O)
VLHKTRGIVLNYLRYRESSVIVNILTEQFGFQSYIVNSIRSARSKQKMAHFQPLTILEMVIYHHTGKDIQRISEYKLHYLYRSAPYHPIKSAVLWFLAEFLLKTLRSEHEDPPTFNFIFNSLVRFDELSDPVANFHLQFLLKLSPFLGFHPEFSEELLESRNKTELISLFDRDYGEHFPFNHDKRLILLDEILDFYHQHIDGIKKIKSLEVLKEVLS